MWLLEMGRIMHKNMHIDGFFFLVKSDYCLDK